jgi:6-pyruvoyltetrahydropterin/6-carboxytetrahydropterin synthase
MFEITKDFEFSAAHHLPQLPEGHKCRRPHGHNYLVRVEISSEKLDERGFVIDYGELTPVSLLVRDLDHQDLNEVTSIVPTAENLAFLIWDLTRRFFPEELYLAVGVSETPKVWAWYRP